MTITPSPIPSMLVTTDGSIIAFLAVDLGPWDMETTPSLVVDIALATTIEILHASVMLENDAGTIYINGPQPTYFFDGVLRSLEMRFTQNTGYWYLGVSTYNTITAGSGWSSTANSRGKLYIIYKE